MTTCDRDIEIFAADLYMFLVPERLGMRHSPAIAPRACDETIYTDDIGKAVLITCYRIQETLYKKFTKDHLQFSKDPDVFLRYCTETGFIMYDEADDDVFDSLFAVSAMILELVAFCYTQKFKIPFWYADFCWAELFKLHFKKSFFENGGWRTLRERSQMDVVIYESAKYDDNKTQMNTPVWLTKFDRNIADLRKLFNIQVESEKGDECDIAFKPKSILKKKLLNRESYRPEKCAVDHQQDPDKDNRLTEANSKYGSIGFGKNLNSQGTSSSIQNVGRDLNSESKDSAKSLGAIPKTRSKIVKEDNEVNLSENELSNIIPRDNDDPGNSLSSSLSSEENTTSLLQDERFIETMKTAVQNPEHRPSNEDMLNYTRNIIKEKTEEADRANIQTESRFSQDAASGESSSNAEQHNSPKSIYITNPLYQSPTKNRNATTRKHAELQDNKVINSTDGLTSDNTKTIPSVDYDIDSLDYFLESFNERLEFKVDKCLRKEKESDISGCLSGKLESNENVMEEVSNVLNRFDSLIDRVSSDQDRLSDDMMKFNKQCRKQRRIVLVNLIKQFLSINNSETDQIISDTQIFTAKKSTEEAIKIMNRLKENSRKNNEAQVAIGFIAPAVISSNTSTQSSFRQGLERSNEFGRRQQPKVSADSSVKVVLSDDDLDNKESLKLRAALKGLLHAHTESRKLLNSLSQRLQQPQLLHPPVKNVETNFPPGIGFGLSTDIIMDLIKNKLSADHTDVNPGSCSSARTHKNDQSSSKLRHKISPKAASQDSSGHLLGDYMLHDPSNPNESLRLTMTVNPPVEEKSGHAKEPDEQLNPKDGFFEFCVRMPNDMKNRPKESVTKSAIFMENKAASENKNLPPVHGIDEVTVSTNRKKKTKKRNRRKD